MPFFSTDFTKSLTSKSSTGDYLNPSAIEDGGSVRFAIVSDSPLEGIEIWFNKAEGGMTKRISAEWPDEELLAQYETEVNGTVTERDGRKAIKPCCAFFVFDYETESIRLFSANQKSLIGEINRLTADEDYSDLSQWDMKLTRNGKGTDTKYAAMMVPTKRSNGKVAALVSAAWAEAKAAGYSLDALFYGGNPFGGDK